MNKIFQKNGEAIGLLAREFAHLEQNAGRTKMRFWPICRINTLSVMVIKKMIDIYGLSSNI